MVNFRFPWVDKLTAIERLNIREGNIRMAVVTAEIDEQQAETLLGKSLLRLIQGSVRNEVLALIALSNIWQQNPQLQPALRVVFSRYAIGRTVMTVIDSKPEV